MSEEQWAKGEAITFEDKEGELHTGVVEEVSADTLAVRSKGVRWDVAREAIRGRPSAMVTCRTCGRDVSKGAANCPYCGESLPGMRVACPECGSPSVNIRSKGFSGGKAVAGLVLLGPVGLLGGLHGRKNIELLCATCGHKWTRRLEELI
jgi:tellurium resistance protein TerD